MEEHGLARIDNRFWTAEERPTICLGVRPDPTTRRDNLEQTTSLVQVYRGCYGNDRSFALSRYNQDEIALIEIDLPTQL